MSAQVDVQGADALARTLHSAGRELQDWAAVNARAAQIVATAAKQRAPKRSGRLSNSIAAQTTKAGAQITAGVPYAKVQEFGWAARGIRPRPYLHPALADSQSRIIPLYEAHVSAAVRTVKGA
jgi:HK97 gp10 family phage protein